MGRRNRGTHQYSSLNTWSSLRERSELTSIGSGRTGKTEQLYQEICRVAKNVLNLAETNELGKEVRHHHKDEKEMLRYVGKSEVGCRRRWMR